MGQGSRLEIVDRDGWRIESPLEKNIVHIGSDPRNDIVLEPERGSGVAPLHAQLVRSTEEMGYQLVNLGDAEISLSTPDSPVLRPRSVVNLTDGATFRMGDFTLTFYGDGGNGGVSGGGSSHVKVGLSLPQRRVEPNRSVEGTVKVGNEGDATGAQIYLEMEGLEEDYYDLEPGPILSSHAEREVLLRIYHRGSKPLAGERQITIRATAPKAYPGEQAVVSQTIQILPFYVHKLHLLPPEEEQPQEEAKKEPVTPPQEVKEEPTAPPRAEVAEQATQVRAEARQKTGGGWWAGLVHALSFQGRTDAPTQPKAEAAPSPVVEQPKPEVEAVAPAMGEVRQEPGVALSPGGGWQSTKIGTAAPAEEWRRWEPEVPLSPASNWRIPKTRTAAPAVEEVKREPEVAPQPVAEQPEPVAEAPAVEEVKRELEVAPLPVAEQPEPVAEAVAPAVEEVKREPEAAPQPAGDWWRPKAKTAAPAKKEEVKREPEVAPSPAGDTDVWWTAGTETDLGLGQKAVKLQSGPPPEEDEEETLVEPGPSPAVSDWSEASWPTDDADSGLGRKVLKLKASAPPEKEEKKVQTEPPVADDWWITEAEG